MCFFVLTEKNFAVNEKWLSARFVLLYWKTERNFTVHEKWLTARFSSVCNIYMHSIFFLLIVHFTCHLSVHILKCKICIYSYSHESRSSLLKWPVIGQFRVPKTLTFKMRLRTQPILWKWVLFAWERKIISN